MSRKTATRRLNLIVSHVGEADRHLPAPDVDHHRRTLSVSPSASTEQKRSNGKPIDFGNAKKKTDKEKDEKTNPAKQAKRQQRAEQYKRLESERLPFDPEQLAKFVEGPRYFEMRRKVGQVFLENRKMFPWNFEIGKDEHRRRTLNQVKFLARQGYLSLDLLKDDPMAYLMSSEPLNMYDPSLPIKAGVHFSLFGGSLINLGTERHFARFWKGANDFSTPGCFAMTELGHGSNVQGIGTVAVYDKARQEFVINTPRDTDRKWWIGNAAHAKVAVVFAQLVVEDKNMGVHAFIVPVRHPDSDRTVPGVQIGDCGYKMGMNGVDNGWFKFKNVRIPRENLLNRFGDVTPDGEYVSKIKSDAKRFGRQLAALTLGRVSLVLASSNLLALGLTIAIRYADRRKQFGPPGEPEQSILDYTSHQRRLMPMLASCFAFQFAGQYLVERYKALDPNDKLQVADLHTLSAGIKALSTWYANSSLQICRECCGGHGYAAFNRFSGIRNDSDIYQTFEGDNTVLMQQVAKDLITQFSKQFAGGQFKGMLKFVGRQAGYLMQENNPVVTNLSSWDHLRSQKFQKQAFAYRVAVLLHSTANHVQKRFRETNDMFHAWNECLPELQHAAEAHVERVILKRFVAKVNECNQPELKRVLKLLCDLFALTRIEKDIGVFSNEGYIRKAKAKSISFLVKALCREVRYHALTLVDSFGIPDHLVHSPLATGTNDPTTGDPLQHIVRYVEQHYQTYP